ncbi:aminotransferase class I/II-fold pyridoxal phosphate-dependent enzyme [Sulfurimonas lithotrophica]|uniref:Aminotransferase class I/II-fold pyridoxal phosphate-dependent enzyme n=1 Tax=Sulfurimonas lithotrophica TaxID=2590022 RepID=A0A5P8P492_9BACT|nr:aminotransferase class I/II-fold pyridoxal phosphate-dependent enzyme [Sulfurimonas lithotrophica]QFR50495.1 aminotransferase class I/II-fold pyridoxal phosphate-dependent enzyme [Sulfurimonas lithotrophica]
MYYENELKALKKSLRYRERKVVDAALKDFASNDYLGLAHNKELHKATSQELEKLPSHSAKASLLVNGYHQVHKDFEVALCEANNFEDAVVVGSGFNANIAMIEALCRKGDMLFMDELYHASGVLATQLEHVSVVFFKHNDMQDLQRLLREHSDAKRKIIAVEGIYSMDGDLCDREVFEIADAQDAILIVDEAHSSGVVGERLMGVFDLYKITPKPNHIKMGTLGKAYGGFGAYILASAHIIDYLINRAKPIIYATALSLYDTLLAHKSLEYIRENREILLGEINLRKMIIQRELGISVDGLIVPIIINDNKKVMDIKELMQKEDYAIGAIRQPTVPKAIVRLIARLGESESDLISLCKKLAKII